MERESSSGSSAAVALAAVAVLLLLCVMGGGVFRISLWVPGRQDAIDTPFTVLAV